MLITETPQYEIHRIYAHNSLRNYTYLIFKKAIGDVTIIDPWDSQVCLDYLSKLSVNNLFLMNTHQHHDHIRGNSALLAFGAQMKVPDDFIVIPLPGHTSEHVVFMLEDQSRHLFAGDTLFQLGVGNCKNGGDPCALYKSIQWLKEHLEPEVSLYVGHDYLKKNLDFLLHVEPGHFQGLALLKSLRAKEGFELPPSKWGEELEVNPFLRLSETALRQGLNRLVEGCDHALLSDKEVFIVLRSLRDHF